MCRYLHIKFVKKKILWLSKINKENFYNSANILWSYVLLALSGKVCNSAKPHDLHNVK